MRPGGTRACQTVMRLHESEAETTVLQSRPPVGICARGQGEVVGAGEQVRKLWVRLKGREVADPGTPRKGRLARFRPAARLTSATLDHLESAQHLSLVRA